MDFYIYKGIFANFYFTTIIVFIFKTSGYNVECDRLCSWSNRSLHEGHDDMDFTLCEYYNVEGKYCSASLARIFIIYGLIAPWSFILLITFVLMIGLCYDWKYFNICIFFKKSQNPCRLSA